MAYKTILVHCDAGRTAAGRVAVAAEVAQRFHGHLAGLHVRARFETPIFTDAGSAMDLLYRTYEERAKADEAAAAATFKQGIARRGLSSEWRTADGAIDQELVVQARYADLVVVGQHDPDAPFTTTPASLPETVAMASGRPVLVVPHIGAAKPPGGTVLLCWNASREAARAAADAMPFLTAAETVIVLVIDPEPSATGHGPEPGADIAAWLTRHGVKVTVQRDSAADSDVANVILSRAADHAVDLIVMGIYGHSRLREMVLGGASRTVLASMTAPVLMAH
jgi:nucleotide-binding universal stress UspA family protein